MEDQNKYESLATIPEDQTKKLPTGNRELDELLGGGFALGGVTLLAGDRGCGKSTLMLQVARNIAHNGNKILYVSGEESGKQVKLRALRIHAVDADIQVTEAVAIEQIVKVVEEVEPQFMIVDSLQMLYSNATSGESGTPKQSRYCLKSIIALARERNIAVLVIGHATKSGSIAGLNTLQHLVDVVVYLQNEVGSERRLIVEKNRFGPAQTGMELKMTKDGFHQLRVGLFRGVNKDNVTQPAVMGATAVPTSDLGYKLAYVILFIPYMLIAVPIYLIKQARSKKALAS